MVAVMYTADGHAGLVVAYLFGIRSWRSDYCEFDFPCWKGGKVS
jgi:hypothetical protein